jgi:hypothetical protein
MLLADIRDFMRQRRRASIDELAVHFECDASAIAGIMDSLAARGIVARLGCGGCGGSSGCAAAGPAVYAYVADGRALAAAPACGSMRLTPAS